MMVVDSSALIAIFEREPEAAAFLRHIAEADEVVVSAVQVHETAVVMLRRRGAEAADRVWAFLAKHDIEVEPFDAPAARDAIAAYQRFGKGTGARAQLNLADCAAYALARRLGAPLLFKGDDFGHTDLAAPAQGRSSPDA